MSNNYIVKVEALKGEDSKAGSAFFNAIRAGGKYGNFIEHYNHELPDYFTKTYYVNKENKTIDLSIGYKNLLLQEVMEIFGEVYKQRYEQFENALTKNIVNFEDLDVLEKSRYTLLYMFGDKVGGWSEIAKMSIEEILKVLNLFLQLNKKQSPNNINDLTEGID